MFETNSRYYKIETVKMTVTDSEGQQRVIAYKRRRFIPSGESMTTLVEHTVSQNERLDNITTRYLADPTLFWQLCDANNAMRPDDLTDEPGHVIKIATAPLA